MATGLPPGRYLAGGIRGLTLVGVDSRRSAAANRPGCAVTGLDCRYASPNHSHLLIPRHTSVNTKSNAVSWRIDALGDGRPV